MNQTHGTEEHIFTSEPFSLITSVQMGVQTTLIAAKYRFHLLTELAGAVVDAGFIKRLPMGINYDTPYPD